MKTELTREEIWGIGDVECIYKPFEEEFKAKIVSVNFREYPLGQYGIKAGTVNLLVEDVGLVINADPENLFKQTADVNAKYEHFQNKVGE